METQKGQVMCPGIHSSTAFTIVFELQGPRQPRNASALHPVPLRNVLAHYNLSVTIYDHSL
jgi:hypothetical protein